MKKVSFSARLWQNMKKHKGLYLMILPVVAFYLVFCYYPMYGAQIAFRDYTPKLGVFHSPWAGLKHFGEFFKSVYFERLIRNTFSINLKNLVFGFPAPILFALLLNEVRSQKYKKFVQTVSYMPHFISTVVVAGMVLQFTATDGFLTQIMTLFGYPKQNLMMNPSLFQPIYVISDIWQGIGWGSIMYLSALSNVDTSLYDVANIDGANRWQKIKNIIWPTIMPTTTVLLIMNVGNVLNSDYTKVLLMQNDTNRSELEVIGTFVYQKGIVEGKFSYSTAVNLFVSIICFILVFGANMITRKVNPENSLW